MEPYHFMWPKKSNLSVRSITWNISFFSDDGHWREEDQCKVGNIEEKWIKEKTRSWGLLCYASRSPKRGKLRWITRKSLILHRNKDQQINQKNSKKNLIMKQTRPQNKNKEKLRLKEKNPYQALPLDEIFLHWKWYEKRLVIRRRERAGCLLKERKRKTEHHPLTHPKKSADMKKWELFLFKVE